MEQLSRVPIVKYRKTKLSDGSRTLLAFQTGAPALIEPRVPWLPSRPRLALADRPIALCPTRPTRMPGMTSPCPRLAGRSFT